MLASVANTDLQNAGACVFVYVWFIISASINIISGSHSGPRDLTCSHGLVSNTRQVNSSSYLGRGREWKQESCLSQQGLSGANLSISIISESCFSSIERRIMKVHDITRAMALGEY